MVVVVWRWLLLPLEGPQLQQPVELAEEERVARELGQEEAQPRLGPHVLPPCSIAWNRASSLLGFGWATRSATILLICDRSASPPAPRRPLLLLLWLLLLWLLLQGRACAARVH